jgi:hypothetical protein
MRPREADHLQGVHLRPDRRSVSNRVFNARPAGVVNHVCSRNVLGCPASHRNFHLTNFGMVKYICSEKTRVLSQQFSHLYREQHRKYSYGLASFTGEKS